MSARIAWFLPSLRGGGAETNAVRLAGGLAAEGVGVDLVIAEPGGELRSAVPPTVRVIDLMCRRVVTALPALAEHLSREQPAALLSSMSHANVVALGAKRLAGVSTRVVVTEHIPPSQGWPRAPRPIIRRIVPALVRTAYRYADTVVAVSEGVKSDLCATLGLPAEEIRVIYNPVVSPQMLSRAREPVSHPWLEDTSVPLLLGVGRLKPQKDFLGLLEALALARRTRPMRLLILGEGPERPRLEARVMELGLENCVDMPGFVSNPFAYMARAALFVLSSRWEGLPTVLIEAMALGCPVVSTNCPSGPSEILEDGLHAPLVPIAEPAALASAILDVLHREIDRDALRRRASAFSLERAVPRYREVLGV